MNLIPKVLTAVNVNAYSHFSDHQGPLGTWVDEADAFSQLFQSFFPGTFPCRNTEEPTCSPKAPSPSLCMGMETCCLQFIIRLITAAFPPLISPHVGVSSCWSLLPAASGAVPAGAAAESLLPGEAKVKLKVKFLSAVQ